MEAQGEKSSPFRVTKRRTAPEEDSSSLATARSNGWAERRDNVSQRGDITLEVRFYRAPPISVYPEFGIRCCENISRFMPTNRLVRMGSVIVLLWGAVVFTSGVLAQEQLIKVKGGHQLGETAEQFFAEGYEKEVLSACSAGDFKGVNRPTKRELKKYCGELAEERQQAISGKRGEYKGSGDLSEMRMDTFTFDGGHLVKVELFFSAPSAEVNYRGQSFEKIFAGVQQAYGPLTSESTEPVRDAYGVQYLAHRELWVAPHAVILITEQPGPGGSTTLVSFTRAEYDRTMAAGIPKAVNPLQ